MTLSLSPCVRGGFSGKSLYGFHPPAQSLNPRAFGVVFQAMGTMEIVKILNVLIPVLSGWFFRRSPTATAPPRMVLIPVLSGWFFRLGLAGQRPIIGVLIPVLSGWFFRRYRVVKIKIILASYSSCVRGRF